MQIWELLETDSKINIKAKEDIKTALESNMTSDQRLLELTAKEFNNTNDKDREAKTETKLDVDFNQGAIKTIPENMTNNVEKI